MSLAEFRQHARDWLDANCPALMRQPLRSDADVCWGGRQWKFQSDEQRLWLERMAARGWTAPTWPAEFGGGGLPPEQARVLREEMHELGARSPLHNFGLWMIGPAILRYGTEQLKRQHIPPIAGGEIRWCQGYSEPNAGSDLAGLQTRAEDRGDHFLVNGQKIWTSYADQCDWMFCLVRTQALGKAQRGISLVLFDMASPGVTVRPIKLISSKSPFCEVFLENVEVGKDQVVGTINDGWTVAKYLLTHEREAISGLTFIEPGARSLHQIVADACGVHNGRLADSFLRTAVTRWELDAKAFELTCRRVSDEASSTEGVGHVSAMLKFYGTELNKRRHEILVAAYGSDALHLDGDSPGDGAIARDWLRSKGNSIEGGTSEIQLNIIAKRILGLG